MSKGTENKKTGSFYTPRWCVDIMLDMSGFSRLDHCSTLASSVMDPACGDGAILLRILEQKLEAGQELGISDDEVRSSLLSSVHGIELDSTEADKCRERLSKTASSHGIEIVPSEWSIITGDAFDECGNFEDKMDFVIGNPPYVRIHNLDEKPDSPYIEGMCDLFYGFYDIGQRMLSSKSKGCLCFISPNAWMNSRAGEAMRKDIEKRCAVGSVLDFGHYQVFDNATTYTAIVTLEKVQNENIRIWSFDEKKKTACIEYDEPVVADNMWIDNIFYPYLTDEIREIISFSVDDIEDDEMRESIDSIQAKMGIETMRNKLYITDKRRYPNDSIEIEMIKGSKGKRFWGIYPYDEEGKLLSKSDMDNKHSEAMSFLRSNKEELLKRNKLDESKWWGYGRSQGIANTYHDKVSIQNIIYPGHAPITVDCPSGIGVFSGVYILGMSKSDIDAALSERMFFDYLRALATYKSGGYYAISNKELERYLRWWTAYKQSDDISRNQRFIQKS